MATETESWMLTTWAVAEVGSWSTVDVQTWNTVNLTGDDTSKEVSAETWSAETKTWATSD